MVIAGTEVLQRGHRCGDLSLAICYHCALRVPSALAETVRSPDG
jgi:hypothetical protein